MRNTKMMMSAAAFAVGALALAGCRTESVGDGGIVNVLTLGVKNDGSEDVSAIVNEATKTKALYFPAGRYKVAAPLRIKHAIRGDGYARRPENGGAYTWFESALVCTNSEMGVVEFWDKVSVSIENIAIKCNTAEAGVRAVGITGSTQGYLSHIGVYNTRGTGVWLSGWGSRAVFVDNLTVFGASDFPPLSKGLVVEGCPDCRLTDIELMGTRIGLEIQNSHTYGSNLHLWTGCMSWKDDGDWWKGTRGLLLGEGAHFAGSQVYPDTSYYAIEQQGQHGICELNNIMYWEDGSQSNCEARDAVFYHRAPGSCAKLTVFGGQIGNEYGEDKPGWTSDFLMEGASVHDLTLMTDYAIKPENLSRIVAGGELPDYTVSYCTNGWCKVADVLTPEPGCVRARVELPDGAMWRLTVRKNDAGVTSVAVKPDSDLCGAHEIMAKEVAKDHVKVFVKSVAAKPLEARFVTESMGVRCRPVHHGRLVQSFRVPGLGQCPRYREVLPIER